MKINWRLMVGLALTASVSLMAQAAGQNRAVVHSNTNGFAASGVVVGPDGVAHAWTANSPKDADVMMKQIEDAMQAAMQSAEGSSEAHQEALKRLRADLDKQRSNVYRSKNVIATGGGGFNAARESAAVVVFEAMEASMRGEWQEDLRIMDKVLRDEAVRVEGDANRTAMGIHLWLTHQGQPVPMYVEGYGAIFNCEVGFPLAPRGKAAKKETRRESGSPWDRAKKEIEGAGPEMGVSAGMAPGDLAVIGRRNPFGLRNEYEEARVESLTEALVNSLAEAKNIRHLKDNEYVVVTVAGAGGNVPTRLTLRAKKGDIDLLADGKLTKEEFRKKVERNVG